MTDQSTYRVSALATAVKKVYQLSDYEFSRYPNANKSCPFCGRDFIKSDLVWPQKQVRNGSQVTVLRHVICAAAVHLITDKQLQKIADVRRRKQFKDMR